MPRRKNTATEAALAHAVKTFNQRVSRAIASGRLPAESAPTRRTMRQIREMFVGMSPQMRGKSMKAMTAELKKISEKDALSLVKTDGGLLLTKYDIERTQRMTEKAKRRLKEEDRRKRKKNREAARVQGQKAQDVPSWGDGISPAKPGQSKSYESARMKLQQLELLAIGGEWSKYRANLTKNLEAHYSGSDLQKAKDFLNSISDAELKQLYESGEDFADQGYHYETSANVSAAISSAEKSLGR